jgi:hypothetical protein
MKKRRRYKPLSDQLRKIIADHELSRYAICKAAEVDPGQLHRFIKGKGRLTTDSLDRIGAVLKLRFVIDE